MTKRYHVLVFGSESRACIAAIRSLGRSRHIVHACSSKSNALGLKSNYATYTCVCPEYDNPDFIPWLKRYITKYNIQMIVPSGGGILTALKGQISEFAHLLPVSTDEHLLFRTTRKTDVTLKFMESDPDLCLMENHPRSSIVDLEREISDTCLPPEGNSFHIKLEDAQSLNSTSDNPQPFHLSTSRHEAVELLKKQSAHWKRALVQETVTGRQVGVSLLMGKNGEAVACSCVIDCHELPHSKGTMSLRKSCWLPKIVDDAIKRLSYLQWIGCAMVEYRYDERTEKFNFIEINFRFWQYLHLDIYAGVDFPLMQLEWFLEQKNIFEYESVLGLKCRDSFPGEVAQLVNELRRNDIDYYNKITSFCHFIIRFFDFRIKSDLLFPGDRRLYFINFSRFFINEINNACSRFFK